MARSWRKVSISEGERVDAGEEKRGAERAERDSRSATSSGGPKSRLQTRRLLKDLLIQSHHTLMVVETSQVLEGSILHS